MSYNAGFFITRQDLVGSTGPHVLLTPGEEGVQGGVRHLVLKIWMGTENRDIHTKSKSLFKLDNLHLTRTGATTIIMLRQEASIPSLVGRSAGLQQKDNL